jgi:hypothetical protein
VNGQRISKVEDGKLGERTENIEGGGREIG